MTDPLNALESISLDRLLRSSIEERWTKVLAAGKNDLSVALARLGEQSVTIAETVSAERLAWAIAFNIEGAPALEAEVDHRRRAQGYRDFWRPETEWSVIWSALSKPLDQPDSHALLGEIALSVACEYRDDWQYPPARPIDRAAANRAFELVYTRNRQKVIGAVAKQFAARAGDPATIADEAWARVFCDYWSARARRRFLGIGRISTLVCKVARYVAADALRKNKSSVSTDNDGGEGGPGTSVSALKELGVSFDPTAKMISAQLQAQIRRCVEYLPVRRRMVVEAVCFQEMKAKQVAEILGVSQAAISQHLTKAGASIRDCLRMHGFDPPE